MSATGSKWTGGKEKHAEDASKITDFEARADKNDKEQVSLLEEMKQHEQYLRRMRQAEDPRLSFSTPEFKEASRVFTENFKVRAPRASRPACPPSPRPAAGAGASRLRDDSCVARSAARWTGRGVMARRCARCAAVQVARPLTRLARLPRRAAPRPQRNFGKPVEYGLVKQYPVRARARALRARARRCAHARPRAVASAGADEAGRPGGRGRQPLAAGQRRQAHRGGNRPRRRVTARHVVASRAETLMHALCVCVIQRSVWRRACVSLLRYRLL